jgi:hypothetical protein
MLPSKGIQNLIRARMLRHGSNFNRIRNLWLRQVLGLFFEAKEIFAFQVPSIVTFYLEDSSDVA